MRAKQRTAAQQAEDRLVYDKPVTLQKQIPDTMEWSDVQHLHANVNKSIAANRFETDEDRLRLKLLFRLRYYSGLNDVRQNPQDYRIEYDGRHYEITDYDDYNERRRVIKITGERYESTVTVYIVKPTVKTVLGVPTKSYPDTGAAIEVRWQTAPSVEKKVNNLVSVVDAAVISCRALSGITSDCAIRRDDGTLWEIVGTPENTGLSDRWMSFKIQKLSGGA